MIRQEIQASVNSYTLNGELTVPSPVLTSTPQDEGDNLSVSPNFQIKLTGTYSYMNIKDTMFVEFTNGSYDYSAYMNVINSTNDYAILQYVDGLTYTDAPEPTDTYEIYFFQLNEQETGVTTLSSSTIPIENGHTGTYFAKVYKNGSAITWEDASGTRNPYYKLFGSLDSHTPDLNCLGWIDYDGLVSLSPTDQLYSMQALPSDGGTIEYGQRLSFYVLLYAPDDENLENILRAKPAVTVTNDEQPGEKPLNVIMMTGNENTWVGEPITDFAEAEDPNEIDQENGGIPKIVTSDCTFSCEDTEHISISGNEVTANAPGSYVIVATDNNTGRSGSVTWTIVEQPDEEPINDLHVELDEGDVKNLDNGVATNTITVYSADPSSGIDDEVITSDCTFTCTNDDPENPAVTFNGNEVTATAPGPELDGSGWIIQATYSVNSHTGQTVFYVLPPEE